MKTIIIWSMLFMHVVDDYYLQGILASMKQKSWWLKQEGYNDKYKNDYLIALFMHALSWSFCIHIPIIVYSLYTGILFSYRPTELLLAISIPVNSIIHANVDNAKANKKSINLVTDQLIHIGQILMVFISFLYSWRLL